MSSVTITKPAASPRAARRHWTALITVGFGLIAVMVAWSSAGTGDYMTRGLVGGDNPAPAIDALRHLDLARLALVQPVMGLGSLLVRAPFAALARALGGGELLEYRLGALACLAAVVMLAAWLVHARRGSVRGLIAAAVAGLILIASPIMINAIQAGHPEELLTAALTVGAVVAAGRGQANAAGVCLGLALGTKQWAVIAIVPVLWALPERRMRAAAIAAGLGIALTVAVPLANPAAFRGAERGVGGTHFTNAFSAWWQFGSALPAGAHAPVRLLPLGLDRGSASAILLGGAMVVAAALCLRVRPRGPGPALALLALLALCRAALDPAPLEYYCAPLLTALAAWEVLGADRLPVVTLMICGGVMALYEPGARLAAAELNLASLALTLAAGAYLAYHTFVVHPRPDPAIRLTAEVARPIHVQ